MDYIIYARRSSEDKKKQIQSIPDQLQWAHKTATEKGLKVLETFSDTKTGRKPGRDGFGAMMDFIEKYDKAKKGDLGVIVWKIDRLARNPIDEGSFKFAFIQKKIKHVIASDREFKEGDNQILMGIEFSTATQYSIELSRNVTRGMKGKVEKGWRPGYAPIGYLNDRFALQGEKVIHCDEERFLYIQKAWRLLLDEHYTPAHILTILNDEWGVKTKENKPISTSGIYSLFTNLFYTGFYEWKGEIVKGAHQPMITLEEFDKAQVVLGRKGKPRKRLHEHAYTGLIRCGECGCMITAEPPKQKMNKKGEVHIYHYLRCTKKNPRIKCSQSYIVVKNLETQIDELLGTIEIPKAMEEWALKELRKQNQVQVKEFSTQRAQIQKEYNENEIMMAMLLKKLLKGVIDDETYQKNKTFFENERKRIQGQLGNYETKEDDWFNRVEKDFNFAREARRAFAAGELGEKRQIFEKLGSNFILKDKRLLVDLRKPFRSIQSGVLQTKSIFGSLEPIKNGLDKLKKVDFDRVIAVWSG